MALFFSGLYVLLVSLNSFVECFALTQAKTVPGRYVWSLVILSCSVAIIRSNTGMSTMFMSTRTGTITASPLGGSVSYFWLDLVDCIWIKSWLLVYLYVSGCAHTKRTLVCCNQINRNKQFYSFTFSNDIALLKLSSDVSITSWVKLASLPSSGMILPHNHPCYLTGYGRISSESEAASCTHHSGFGGLFLDTVHACLSPVYLKLLEACRQEWDRPSFLLLTMRHVPALAGGAAPSSLTWSAQEVKLGQDVMWVCCRK